MRDGDWKLVTDDKGRAELYHSPDDWSEAKDAAGEHPEMVAQLSAKLEAWKATLPTEPAANCMSKDKRGAKPDKVQD